MSIYTRNSLITLALPTLYCFIEKCIAHFFIIFVCYSDLLTTCLC